MGQLSKMKVGVFQQLVSPVSLASHIYNRGRGKSSLNNSGRKFNRCNSREKPVALGFSHLSEQEDLSIYEKNCFLTLMENGEVFGAQIQVNQPVLFKCIVKNKFCSYASNNLQLNLNQCIGIQLYQPIFILKDYRLSMGRGHLQNGDVRNCSASQT